MKLLGDMNLSPRWVKLLTGAGIEAVHWSTVGAKNSSDAAIMAYALAHDSWCSPMTSTSVPSWPQRMVTSLVLCSPGQMR